MYYTVTALLWICDPAALWDIKQQANFSKTVMPCIMAS